MRPRAWATGWWRWWFVMVLSGGLVAGIRAGLAYNSFPADERAFPAARELRGRALVAQFLHQHGDWCSSTTA
jgi:heme A synthase